MRTVPLALAFLASVGLAARAPLAHAQSAPVEMIHIEPPEPPASEPAAPPTAAPPTPPPERVWVHLNADPGVSLEGLSPEGNWERACSAPCDVQVTTGSDYRVTGAGMYASRAFKLQAEPGQRVVLDVSGASKAGFGVGIALVTVGSLATALGLYVAFLAATIASTCEGTDEGTACQDNSGTVKTSLVVAGAGAVSLLAGALLAESNRQTTTSQSLNRGPSIARRDHDGAWLRVPTWTEPSGLERAVPAAQVVPIFSRSF